jgi:hypothetical protein
MECASLSVAMSSVLIIPPSAIQLARKAWLHVTGLLLLGLLGAAALAFYGYQIHQLSAAVVSYREVETEYTLRKLAIYELSDMKTAFNRFLLDGNFANLYLMQAYQRMIEKTAQSSKDDQLLQNLVSTQQKWNDQVAQPLIEARKKLSANQGLPEDLLAKYRAPGQDLDVSSFGIPAESKYMSAREALLRAEFQMRWLWVPYPLAVLLMVGIIALSVSAMKRVNHLKLTAESGGDEDDTDSTNEPGEAK